MSRQPDASAALEALIWPAAAAGEAMYALAEYVGMPLVAGGAGAMSDGLSADEVTHWLEAAAERSGMQADQLFSSLDEIDALLAAAAPALLRLTTNADAGFLAVVETREHSLRILGPDLQIHRVRRSAAVNAVRVPFEAKAREEIGPTIDRMGLAPAARARASAALVNDRLKAVMFRNCWVLRLSPGAAVRLQAKEAQLPRTLAILGTVQVAQYALFIASWWLLGRSVMLGTLDRGWVLGWLLLLASLIPLRLLSTWTQGQVAIDVGVWIRRRLLRGAFRIDRQTIRQRGVGRLFGMVVEAAALDALALTGGIVAAFAIVELLIASAILWLGATALLVPVLAVWVAATGFLAWRYFHRRRIWTGDRMAMSDTLLEAMVGHRTRLAQQPPGEQHAREDEQLDRYLTQSQSMDDTGVWLTGVMPRGWLVLALAFLTSALAGGASPERLAVSVGAVLLAYRSLQRLTGGLTNLTSAIVAAGIVRPLANAAAIPELPSLPLNVLRSVGEPRSSPVALARDLTFRYRSRGDAVLQGCELTISRGTRLLLEGASGSGKTTLASLLAGMETPESGLLLVDGLDRGTLGAAGWRTRVVMAPQAHDNFLVGGTLAFNLLMGRNWPPSRGDLVEAEAVCRELGLGDLLNRLPGGLQQMVGETGWQLSQGERVRVFLARALLQRPELLILDESFSALDAENVDRAIRTVLHRAPTVLAIAHP